MELRAWNDLDARLPEQPEYETVSRYRLCGATLHSPVE
jgi:hypothetical protein